MKKLFIISTFVFMNVFAFAQIPLRSSVVNQIAFGDTLQHRINTDTTKINSTNSLSIYIGNLNSASWDILGKFTQYKDALFSDFARFSDSLAVGLDSAIFSYDAITGLKIENGYLTNLNIQGGALYLNSGTTQLEVDPGSGFTFAGNAIHNNNVSIVDTLKSDKITSYSADTIDIQDDVFIDSTLTVTQDITGSSDVYINDSITSATCKSGKIYSTGDAQVDGNATLGNATTDKVVISGNLDCKDTLNIIDATNADTTNIFDNGTITIVNSDNPISFNQATLLNTPKFQFGGSVANTYSLNVINFSPDISIWNANSGANYTSLRFALRSSSIAYGIIACKYVGSNLSDLILSNGIGAVVESMALRSDGTITLYGNTARTFQLDRHTTSNTAGVNMTFGGGGATPAATDKGGGMRTYTIGTSTGTGFSSNRFQRMSRASSTGTSDNTASDAFIIPSQNFLADNVAKGLFEVALLNDEGAGGTIEFSIVATDGDTTQTYSGVVHYAFADGNNTVTTVITEANAVTIDVPAAVTDMTTAWTVTSTAGTKVVINVTANTGFAPTNINIYYTIHNGSVNSITQL
jgi:hypothetical protein